MQDPFWNTESEAVSRARLAAIVDSSDDVIVSKTLDGVITSWNSAAERLFGWTAAEAVGQHITLIIPEDRRAEEDHVLARLRRGERVDHFETMRITKTGRLVDMSITVSPIKDASGRIIGASKVGRDISERRRMEDERAALLVREQEARRQAEALNRAKDELLATVSHELRTPLNAIFGWARLLKDGELDEPAQARAVDTIIRNAALQARLVEDLLDLSRIVAGRMRLALEPTDLNATIEAALDTVRPAAQAKDIALVATLDDAVGLIQGAPDRLQQVVWNLVMNSIKFTAPGGRVDIVSRRDATGVAFSVADTGQGIDASVLPYVFEPFHQADSSTTRAHGGLGLGLTLVRRLVEAHGGTVTAESAGRNRGSTFTVTFPLPTSGRLPGTRADGLPSEQTRRAMALRLQGTRVLLVDDDADFLELSAISLRRAGAEVRTASSAAAAYNVADSWRPMVVVTDLAMPDEDGFVLARTMRRIFRRQRAHVPIVAVTAYGTPEIRARVDREGFDLYVTKPVDPPELTNVVASLALRGS
jgi:PAS domain S-box-containing protein